MRRDPRAFLWDVRDSADAILDFVRGRGWDDYQSDRMLRSAVERQFEIIGEALNRLSSVSPDIAAGVPGLPQIVAFRNILIHGYATVDDATVWRTIQDDLPDLRRRAASLLRELGEEP